MSKVLNDATRPKRQPKGDYPVGYCSPPAHTRFTAENNPRGRRRGSKNMSTLLREELAVKISVKEGGRERRLSRQHVIVKKALNKAIETADLKTALLLLRSLEGDTSSTRTSTSEEALLPKPDSVADQSILAWFLAANADEEAA